MPADRTLTKSGIGVIAALVAAMACLAGCGALPYRGTAATPTPVVRRTPQAHAATRRIDLGPPGGSKAEASALATSMLAHAVLPTGARSEPAWPLPRSVRQYDMATHVAGEVDLTRLFLLPMPMSQAAGYLQSHVPSRFANAAGGSTGLLGETTSQDLEYSLRRLPRGIFAADLYYTVVPARGGSTALLAVDAQVTWYPSRSAAEYIQPASFRSVSITVTSTPTHYVERTVHSPAVIAALAKLLDSLPASPPGSFITCPLPNSFLLRFGATHSHHEIVVVGYGCPYVDITVRSAKQPALYVKDIVSLAKRLRRIIGIHLAH
jgi:hypothetical protein